MNSAFFDIINKPAHIVKQLLVKLNLGQVNSSAREVQNIKQVLALFIISALIIGGFYAYLFLRAGRDNLLTGHYKIAYYQFISRAEKGEPAAQNIIGNLYFLGLGVKQNQPAAARWYLKAALQGSVAAQLNLGQIYWNGQGLPARPLKALGWFVLARNLGSKRADGHIRYMIQANSILPNMIEAAKRDYKELAIVNKRYTTLGENDFLLK